MTNWEYLEGILMPIALENYKDPDDALAKVEKILEATFVYLRGKSLAIAYPELYMEMCVDMSPEGRHSFANKIKGKFGIILEYGLYYKYSQLNDIDMLNIQFTMKDLLSEYHEISGSKSSYRVLDAMDAEYQPELGLVFLVDLPIVFEVRMMVNNPQQCKNYPATDSIHVIEKIGESDG